MKKKHGLAFALMIPLILSGSFTATAAEISDRENSSSSSQTDQNTQTNTPKGVSLIEQKFQDQNRLGDVPNFISLQKINYILPYYYTFSPDIAVYQGTTPNNQNITPAELKGQLSVDLPVIYHLFYNEDLSLHIAYTQLSYWQVYADSQYFRETDYEPSAFLNYHVYHDVMLSAGIDHQSNGQGGQNERSWNRAFGSVQFGGENWFVEVDGWGLILQEQSSNLNNPDIEKYLGHDHITLVYKVSNLVLTFEIQNIESLLNNEGYFMVSANYPLGNRINLMAQYFNGYGQSLIEYNHFTQAFGAGFSFNSLL